MANENQIMIEDAERFRHLANAERTCVAANDFCVQVIHDKVWYTEYFRLPPKGIPKVLHPNPLEALRSAVDQIREKVRQDTKLVK